MAPRALASLLLGLSALAIPADIGAEVLECRRITLSPAPESGGSGAWGADGRELFLVDPRGGKLLRYGADGSFRGEVARPGSGPLEFSAPLEMVPLADGFLLLDEDSRLLWLGPDGVPRRGSNLGRSPFLAAEGLRILDVCDLQMDESRSVAYALLSMERKAGLAMGWVRLRLEPPEKLEFLDEMARDPREVQYALDAGPTIAFLGDAAYILRARGERVQIEQVAPTKRVLAALPDGFGVLPKLPLPSRDTLASYWLAQDQARQLSQLVARGDFLYLLSKEPDPAGGIRWQLHRIDPRLDKVVASRRIPTRARDLRVVPGNRQWAFVELGPVLTASQYDIHTALLVPTSWIEAPGASPLDSGDGGCR